MGNEKMAIKYILGEVVICMSVLTTHAHAIPTTYMYNGSGEITGVAALDINGTLWDMTLYDGSYTSLFTELGSDALYGETFSRDASMALVDFTNYQIKLPSDFLGCTLLTACAISTFYDYPIAQINVNAYSAVITPTGVDYVTSIYEDPDITYPQVTYATWELSAASVPEPSVVLLIASGLMVFGIARRKDRT